MSVSTRRRAIAGAACAVAAALTIAACGGTGTDPSAPTPDFGSATETPGFAGSGTPVTGMPGMPHMSAMSAPAPAPVPAPAPAPAVEPVPGDAVSIENFAFTPASLTVPVGATVTWTNHDEEPHTVASADGSFHSPGIGTGATYTFTFTKAGTFDYICSIHPFMHATVVVTP